jgi:glycerophosphoryl diester phosphodiesterase
VRLTEDGEPVVAHDPRFGKYRIERTLAQQVSSLPRLRDVLKRYQEKAFLDIEVKVKGLERTIVDLFLRHKPRKGCVVSSFLPSAIKALHEHDSTIPLGLICETPTQLREWSELPIAYVISNHELCQAEFVRKVKGAGKKMIVWSVNEAAEMQRFSELGVDGIISDETGLLCRTLKV